MAKIALSEIMNEKGRMYTWSLKVLNNVELSEEEKEITRVVDAFAKEIADTGVANVALSQYLQKVVEPEVYNAPSELLDMMFDLDEIGEFDEISTTGGYVNRLLAHEAGRGGNVNKSYIDFSKGVKNSHFLQIETELKMSDLRKNGYKSIAKLTEFAVEAFNDKKFYLVFNKIDSLITNGTESSGGLTVSAMDDFAGYLSDNGSDPVIIGRTDDLRDIKNMQGYDKFLSENMKNEIHTKSPILSTYNGVKIADIKASKKLADGTPLLTPKKLYGIADKIGGLTMRGQLRVLQESDINREVIHLKFTGFEFVYIINDLDKVTKLTVS